jgi:TonB family protein
MSRRRDPDRTSPRTILTVLLVSIGVHAALWPLGDRVVKLDWGAPPLPTSGSVLEVDLVGMGGAASPLDPPEPPPDQPPDPPPEPPPEPPPSGRLVQLDRVVQERAPDDAKYVSEFDSSTDRPTKAPNRRPVDGVAPVTPGQSEKATGDKPSPTPESTAKALSLGQRLDGPSRDDDGRSASALDAAQDAERGEAPSSAGGSNSPSPSGLRGSPRALQQVFGQPGSYDAIDDAEEGDATVLNSRRWKYASFYNRMRDQIAREWDPVTLHRARDPDGRAYGLTPKTTKLAIRMNPDGSVARIHVVRSSGVDFLDEEAIRAVRAAAPFVNPPAQLVDAQTGAIDVFFSFILDFRSGPAIYRFRQ